MAVPLSFSVIIGKAILRDVASRAAARVIMHIDTKARIKPLPGLKAGFTSSNGGRLDFSLDSDRLALLSEGSDSVEGFSLRDEGAPRALTFAEVVDIVVNA